MVKEIKVPNDIYDIIKNKYLTLDSYCKHNIQEIELLLKDKVITTELPLNTFTTFKSKVNYNRVKNILENVQPINTKTSEEKINYITDKLSIIKDMVNDLYSIEKEANKNKNKIRSLTKIENLKIADRNELGVIKGYVDLSKENFASIMVKYPDYFTLVIEEEQLKHIVSFISSTSDIDFNENSLSRLFFGILHNNITFNYLTKNPLPYGFITLKDIQAILEEEKLTRELFTLINQIDSLIYDNNSDVDYIYDVVSNVIQNMNLTHLDNGIIVVLKSLFSIN